MGGLTTGGVADVGDDVLLARAYLSRVAEAGSPEIADFVGRLGPVLAAARIRTGDTPSAVASAVEARRVIADPEADLETAARHGIRLVVPESDDWPHFGFAAFAATRGAAIRGAAIRGASPPVAPLALWVKGAAELATVGVRSVAIVGARAATTYGEQVAGSLAFGLARKDVTVVSGGAFGIDAAAHRGALAANAATVLVSAGGLDQAYPPSHARLFDQVADSGLLVSESPPGAAPHRHRFLTRNRLIAAFGVGTVVVEAALRSGARNTAHHCIALGRPLMVVPGPVTSSMSAGCHELLRRAELGACLVTSVDDVLAVVGSIGEGINTLPAPPGDDLNARLDRIDPLARRVFDGLPARGPVREDALAIRAGVSVIEVLRALPALRLAGLVDSTAVGHCIAPGVRSTRGGAGTSARWTG